MIFAIVIVIVIMQRLGELVIAKRNEVWLRKQGAVEYGKSHYKYIMMLHVLWFASMLIEYRYRNGWVDIGLTSFSIVMLSIFAMLQVMRVWVLSALGKYWNTKILVVPGAKLVAKGPYRFLKHPNYAIVVLELLVLPLAFGLIITAALISILNAAVLYVRIREENKALGYD